MHSVLHSVGLSDFQVSSILEPAGTTPPSDPSAPETVRNQAPPPATDLSIAPDQFNVVDVPPYAFTLISVVNALTDEIRSENK